jgi:hypothetical protein
MDLTEHRLDDSSATTVICRFLSITVWCGRQFRHARFRVVPESRSGASQQASTRVPFNAAYVFDRKMPSTPEACRALALSGPNLSFAVERSPDATAITDRERRLGYASWYQEIGRVAGGLTALGLERG